MKQLNEQVALHFILQRMHEKIGEGETYERFLSRNNLLAGSELANTENKRPAFEGSKVMMTDEQYARLEMYYSKDDLRRIYDKLDSFLGNKKNKHYKCHYSAINNWVIDAVLGGKNYTPLDQEVPHWNQGD